MLLFSNRHDMAGHKLNIMLSNSNTASENCDNSHSYHSAAAFVQPA